jgi:hypothetical protein
MTKKINIDLIQGNMIDNKRRVNSQNTLPKLLDWINSIEIDLKKPQSFFI